MLVAAEDPLITRTRNMLGSDWMQETPGGIKLGILTPGNDPLAKLFTGPSKITKLTKDSLRYGEEIEYYVLDGLRAYIFAPGSNPVDKIWTHKGDAERGQYGEYLQVYKDQAFWQLAITATIDNLGGDLQKCRAGLIFISANNHAYISVAKEAFAQGNDLSAMFNLMFAQRHNMDACADFRAAYRTNRAAFITLVNSF